LASEASEERDEMERGKLLLEFLIDTNAIGFTQDLKTGPWMVGYYQNNAALRLSLLTEHKEAQKLLRLTTNDAQLLKDRVLEQHSNWRPMQAWKHALEGYDLVFRTLKQRIAETRSQHLF